MSDIDDLLTRLALRIVDGADQGVPLPMRMCRAGVHILGCDGGAITLAYTQLERVTLCATDDTALRIEELQDVLAQGPGPDAFDTGEYVRWDVSRRHADDPRWPMLTSAALNDLEPLSVHALPMGAGADRIGVLTMYQLGTNAELDLETADRLARVIGGALLTDVPTQQEAGHGPWAERAEVHQATGMVIAQLGVNDGDAVALIRAHAYARGQSVGATAADIVARTLTFSTTRDHGIESS